MKNLLFLLLLFFGMHVSVMAIKDPVKFGNVSLDELKMTSYDADTSAEAVVLCDYGYFDPQDFTFTRITRIKILKKSGCDLATKVFPAYTDARVKGITFNLENGVVTETKLESSSIFTETINGHLTRLRIAMPNVKVGSVMDLKFVHFSLPYVWEFQMAVPVKHSELVVDKNPYVTFRQDLTGFQPLSKNEVGHWVADNMPAFRAEAYISCPDNYMTRLTFDILEIKYRNYYNPITTSLEAMCNQLRQDQYFGVPLFSDGYLNKTAKEIKIVAKTDRDKIRLAFDHIKKYKWNKYISLYTTNTSIKTSLDKQSGNSADINLALVQLLRKLDLNVTPVLISTRDNGFLSPVHPSLNRLNNVIVAVDLNGEQLLLDATEANAPYDLLAERDLNLFGWTYNYNKSTVVELEPKKKEKQSVIYNLKLDDELQFKGTLSFRRYDYAALDFRNKYKDFSGQDAFLEDFLMHHPGLRINAATIENVDSLYLPVKDQYDITLKNSIDEADGKILVYPMFLHKMEENPFKSDQRNYPVDFVHPIENTYSVTLTLPDNLEVASVPETIKMGLPGGTASFMYQITVMGKVIQFNYKFMINNTVYPEHQYRDVKEFFNQIIAKHAEPIILKKL